MANTKVTGDVIANGTISTVHIADDAITAAKLDSTATGITFADLAVSGNSTLTGNLTVNGAFTSQGIDDNADATAITINGNEEVGIGTISPFTKLHVETTASQIARFSYNSTNYQDLTYEGSNIVGGSHVFKIAGSEKMRLDTSGNVGIGITTPGTLHSVSYGTTKLHIDGGTDRGQIILEGDTLANIVMSDNGATANSRVFLAQVNDGLMHFKSVNDNGTSKATIMSMTSSGNVGIGTTSPSATKPTGSLIATGWGISDSRALEISASNFANSGLFLRNNDNATGTDITSDNYYGNTFIDNRYNNDNGDIYFRTKTAGTPQIRMTIEGGGNVGIGRTSPVSILELGADTPTLTISDTGNNYNNGDVQAVVHLSGRWYSGTANPASDNYSDARIVLRKNSSDGTGGSSLAFETSANAGAGLAEAIRIDKSQNVGIGTISPTTLLSVSDGASMYANNNYLVQIKRNATNGNDDTSKASILLANNSNAFQIAYGGTTDRLRFINGGGAEQMTLLNGGNVGIGRTDPNARLDIKGAGGGAGLTFQATDASNNQIFYIQDGGRVGVRYYPFVIGADSSTTVSGTYNKFAVYNSSTRAVSINYQDGINTIMSHAGDPNYGLEALTIRGDYIAFYTDYDASHYQGVERMRITSGGTVTIGAPSSVASAAKLQLGEALSAGSSAVFQANGFVRIEHGLLIHWDSDNAYAGYLQYSGTNGFSFTTEGGGSGNVGIGTTSPQSKLHVNGGGINLEQGGQLTERTTGIESSAAQNTWYTVHTFNQYELTLFFLLVGFEDDLGDGNNRTAIFVDSGSTSYGSGFAPTRLTGSTSIEAQRSGQALQIRFTHTAGGSNRQLRWSLITVTGN